MASTGPVRVTIFNQSYSLASSENESEIHELAHTVDELMRTISRSGGNLDSTRTAVLACLHLADQLRSLQREYDALKSKVEEKAEHYSHLLDRAIGD
jgi:cell division protein ZapA